MEGTWVIAILFIILGYLTKKSFKYVGLQLEECGMRGCYCGHEQFL